MRKKFLSVLIVFVMLLAALVSLRLNKVPVYAASPDMKIIVPAYFGTNADYWSTMTTQAGLYPGKIYAIINVNSGPGTQTDSVLLSRIVAFRSAGGKILAYVNTFDYPTQTFLPIATVKQDVDDWYSWYVNGGVSQIDGVFYDQMYPWNGGQEAFYRNLYTYVKEKDANDLVVGNPGGNTSETYVEYNGNRLTDVICTFETEYSRIPSWPFQSWQANYSYDRFYFLPHSASTSAQMLDALNQAVARNYGWFYCTDDSMEGDGNPWNTLPAYFAEMCSAVNAVGTSTYPEITVDGNGADWALLPSLATGAATLHTLKVTNDAARLYLLIEGSDLNVTSNFYIDTDNDSSTGYNAYGWEVNGSDYMIENNILYKHNGSGWSWTPVATLDSSQFVRLNAVIEAGIPLSLMNINAGSTIRIGFIKNNSQNERLPVFGEELGLQRLLP